MTTLEFTSQAAPSVPRMQRVGRYEPLRQLSVGSDGVAVLAHDPSSRGEVELRYLTRARPGSERWAEIEAVLQRHAMLEHPVCAPVEDIDRSGDTAVVVMPAAPGASLATRLEQGALPQAEVLRITERIAHGLGAAHRLGLHQGALAPAAVTLVGDPAMPRVDFTGLRVAPDGSDSPWAIACRAPELAREASDSSSDVYALGAMVLGMLLGHAPTTAELRAPDRTIAGPLGALLGTMLASERDARPTAAEVCIELRQAVTVSGNVVGVRADANTMLPGTAGREANGDDAIHEGSALGRFQLVKRLGSGGMGVVFQGIDLGSGETVALKVLHARFSDDAALLRRFKKEARTLGEIRNPYVANLLDLNFDRGVHYIAMEFVAGPCLADAPETASRMAERDALAIAGDVCRALAEPHKRGIVHRDIKPENIMFIEGGQAAQSGQRVKLCDFGIARNMATRETVQMTQEGAIIGTPLFMAPEQCSSGVIGPATDVYSLGVTLFTLIAGRTPFDSEEPMKLMMMHINDAPPSLAELAPDTSAATVELVARALEKDASKRFADAAEMLDAIERILRGEPSNIAVHPQLPVVRSDRVARHVFEWELSASPEELWPYVSNTDRMNRAIGLPPAKFEFREGGEGTRDRIGSNKVAGVALQWKEFPFEWVEARRWGVLRVFEKGLLRWYVVELELIPRPGGTLLRFTMRFEPRNLIAKLLVAFEVGFKQRRALGKMYRRIDAAITEQLIRKPEVDPFHPATPLARDAEQTLERVARELRAEGIEPAVLEHLISYIRHAPAQEAARIRPLALARRFQLDPDAMVGACLHAARKGLLVLLWDVLCPLCRVPSDFVDSLKNIADHANCAACNVEFKLDFARSIEMIFRVAPAIRECETQTFCVGGPSHSPHVVAQVRLKPDERFVLSLGLAAGEYRLRSPQLPQARTVRVGPGGYPHRADLEIGRGDTDRVLHLGPDEQMLAVTNVLDREIVMRVERAAAREDALTAARASSMAVFRQLFPDEILAPGQLVAVTNIVLLVTDVIGVDAMFRQRGDARAFEILIKHFRILAARVSSDGGALIKTVGNGIVAAFETPTAAVRAALSLQTELRNEPLTAGLTLRAVIHQGPAMAATLNETLDYFGQTVSATHDLLTAARGGKIVLSRTVADEPSVSELLVGEGLQPETECVELGEGPTWVLSIDNALLAQHAERGLEN